MWRSKRLDGPAARFWLRRRAVALAATAIVALGATPAVAGEIEGEDASEQLYLSYCASCHGTGGRGDGTLGALLAIEPADLTQLAKRNGGIFPFRSVLRSIDGRTAVRGHGSGMPVWGEIFAPPPGASMREQLESYGKLFLVTFHVESLQDVSDTD